MSNKKNVFKEITKNINYYNLKHMGKIIWNIDLEPEKRFKMIDYISYIKSTDIYEGFNEKININFDEYVNYKILGICNLDNLKLISIDPSEFIFLITDQHYKSLYISIGKCHPLFWYKFTSKKSFIDNFDKIYEIYNPTHYPINFPNKINGFIGNDEILSLNIHDIENHLILNKYTDKLIWGSNWLDHPFRNEYTKKNVTYVDSIIYTGQSMRQHENSEYSVNVRTNYSKSIITIYYYEDAFILELKYNSIDTKQIESINNIFGRKYQSDIPIDVIIALINFPFVTCTSILNMKPLTIFHFYVVTLLANNTQLFDNILPQLNTIVDDKTNDYDTIKEYVYDFIQKNNSDKLLAQIISENDIYEIIENINELSEIDKIIYDVLEKYKCVDNNYIKNILTEMFINGINLMDKFDK